jgi:hydrogenase maturation protease
MFRGGTSQATFFIVGYGNPYRRDDGIGPYVAHQLESFLYHRKNIHYRVLHQLEPCLISALQYADIILFVDATIQTLAEGRQWVMIQPDIKAIPSFTHQCSPPMVMGWLQSIHHRNPAAWLVSVQGNDFDFGKGLSFEAKKKSRQVVSEIAEYILTYSVEQDRIIPKRWKSEARNTKS